ncbi:MAG: DUF6779 domain-containing protein [Mycobacteriaceae bacterium]
MTVPVRAKASRRGSRSASQFFLTALFFLVIVAGAFLMFADSPDLLKVGIAVAVWAALVGAFAVTKFRRESEADKAKVRDLKLIYELQLEREISARREYELMAENQIRRQVENEARSQSVEEIAALRAELSSLRANLAAIFDTDLGVERPILQANAVRMSEIPERVSTPFAPIDTMSPDRFPLPGSPLASGHITEAQGRLNFGTADNARVTVETPIVEYPDKPAVDVHYVEEAADAYYGSQGYTEIPEPPLEPSIPVQHAAPVAAQEPPRRSHRRAAEPEAGGEPPAQDSGAHSQGRSVSELLAKLQAADAAEQGGRRRRRD